VTSLTRGFEAGVDNILSIGSVGMMKKTAGSQDEK
jgi:hypothetical protein